MRPLADLLVLDFTTLLPGPMATLFLAEAGAEVVKIERPDGGDDMRGYDPPWGASGAAFALLNRGKTSLALDLKNPQDLARLEPLLERADVIVEQFRPGVMERLGLGYDALSTRFPRLIYCSISGYGQTGPRRAEAGHDLNYIGACGLLALSSGPADRPVVPPGLMADIGGGAYPAVMNILLALEERRRTGRGRHLDIAMAESVFPFLFWALGQGQATGTFPGNATALLSGGSARYRLYPTRDGHLVAAAPIEDKFWARFCAVIGLEHGLREDARDPQATIAAVAAAIAAEDGEVWRRRFAADDCCATLVASLEEALADPHFRERGLFAWSVENEAGERMTALPVPIDPAFRGPPEEPLPVPGLGGGASHGR